jgi:hypothetical protein
MGSLGKGEKKKFGPREGTVSKRGERGTERDKKKKFNFSSVYV